MPVGGAAKSAGCRTVGRSDPLRHQRDDSAAGVRADQVPRRRCASARQRVAPRPHPASRGKDVIVCSLDIFESDGSSAETTTTTAATSTSSLSPQAKRQRGTSNTAVQHATRGGGKAASADINSAAAAAASMAAANDDDETVLRNMLPDDVRQKLERFDRELVDAKADAASLLQQQRLRYGHLAWRGPPEPERRPGRATPAAQQLQQRLKGAAGGNGGLSSRADVAAVVAPNVLQGTPAFHRVGDPTAAAQHRRVPPTAAAGPSSVVVQDSQDNTTATVAMVAFLSSQLEASQERERRVAAQLSLAQRERDEALASCTQWRDAATSSAAELRALKEQFTATESAWADRFSSLQASIEVQILRARAEHVRATGPSNMAGVVHSRAHRDDARHRTASLRSERTRGAQPAPPAGLSDSVGECAFDEHRSAAAGVVGVHPRTAMSTTSTAADESDTDRGEASGAVPHGHHAFPPRGSAVPPQTETQFWFAKYQAAMRALGSAKGELEAAQRHNDRQLRLQGQPPLLSGRSDSHRDHGAPTGLAATGGRRVMTAHDELPSTCSDDDDDDEAQRQMIS